MEPDWKALWGNLVNAITELKAASGEVGDDLKVSIKLTLGGKRKEAKKHG